MSYSHHFSGVTFYSELPFDEIEARFREFCEEVSEWINKGELVIRHENDEWDKEAGASRNRGGGPTEVEVYLHHGLVDAKVTYGLMEWVRKLMAARVGGKKQVMRVYCSSSSDGAKEAPFFYAVSKNAIEAIGVDKLFAGRRLKLERQSHDEGVR